MKNILIEKTNDDIHPRYYLKMNRKLIDEGICFMDSWQLLKEIKNIEPNSLMATVDVPENSKWFEGHFPGEPILPGIALVSVVCQAIKLDAQIKEDEVVLCSLKRIRFTGPVRPGEKLLVTMTSEHVNQEIFYTFKIALKENVVSSGLVAVARMKKDKIF